MSCHWALVVGKSKSTPSEEVSWKAPLKVLAVNPELGLPQQAVLGRCCLKKERWWEQALLDRPSLRQRNGNGSSLSPGKAEQVPRLRSLPSCALSQQTGLSQTCTQQVTWQGTMGDVDRASLILQQPLCRLRYLQDPSSRVCSLASWQHLGTSCWSSRGPGQCTSASQLHHNRGVRDRNQMSSFHPEYMRLDKSIKGL